MRIEVIVGTAEEFEAAAKRPADGLTVEECVSYVNGLLEPACERKEAVLDMQCVGKTGKPSDMFAAINNVEQPLVEFVRNHPYPEKVRIICDDEETAKLYKVVYNMFYAGIKAERLEDDDWD